MPDAIHDYAHFPEPDAEPDAEPEQLVSIDAIVIVLVPESVEPGDVIVAYYAVQSGDAPGDQRNGTAYRARPPRSGPRGDDPPDFTPPFA